MEDQEERTFSHSTLDELGDEGLELRPRNMLTLSVQVVLRTQSAQKIHTRQAHSHPDNQLPKSRSDRKCGWCRNGGCNGLDHGCLDRHAHLPMPSQTQ
jgi:hypothetical protein